MDGFHIPFQYKKTIDSTLMVYHTIVINMSKTDDELRNIDITTINNYVLLITELGEYGHTNIDKLSLYYIIEF